MIQLTQIECALHMHCVTDYIDNFTNRRFLFRNKNAQLEKMLFLRSRFLLMGSIAKRVLEIYHKINYAKSYIVEHSLF